MPVVILCGGRGTRLRDVGESLPKPMFSIGNKPIVWHIMKYYAHFGFKKFVLCLGFQADKFVDYFVNYRAYNSDVTLTLGEMHKANFHTPNNEEGWEVTLAHTGLDSMTGCRLFRAGQYLNDEHFMLTYGDGLSNINLNALVEFHTSHNKLVTISAVHPSGRFGEMEIDGTSVRSFNEKPQTSAGYINGGFMMCHRDFLKRYLSDDMSLVLEQAPLIHAANDNQIEAFCHDGFWQCMDTPREYGYLNQLWQTQKAPWKLW
ncbi:MAG: glucose-1-phosphate cytidylyltransferase [Deltaproteobacteria bacterium CG11_big_fil_rev_8_21_14_0_20_47_16]|nr:MAG: glucose-1-phosphate cytidylyltransferase [Deltaproteobacteria bacterium CG11_big_fil_rev_8_21_14_0_20_47_16]